MITKCLEVRDRATFIPVVAIAPVPSNAGQRYLIRRAGYSGFAGEAVIVIKLVDCRASYDPHDWGGRTMPVAHQYIAKHFDELQDGDVVDVEFILGESTEPKRSEREEHQL